MTTPQPTPPPHAGRLQCDVRHLIRRDLPEVLAIENASFEFPWTERDFIDAFRHQNCIPRVAEHDGQIVGFVVYELHQSRLHVLNFCVHPGFRRRGVGQQMVAKLVSRLSPKNRDQMMLEVRETNVAAQVFFRSQGFRAVSVLRGYYDDTPEDAYLFQYRLEVGVGVGQ